MRSFLDTGTRRAGEISGVKSRYTTQNPIIDDLRINIFGSKLVKIVLVWFQYACRKALADNQPRIRGRFAKTEERK